MIEDLIGHNWLNSFSVKRKSVWDIRLGAKKEEELQFFF